MNSAGYISPKAEISHPDVRFGKYVFVGDHAVIFHADGGGPVEIGDRARVYGFNVLETGKGGAIRVGADTRLQRGSQFYSYQTPILIGCDVGIAPNCAFYSYNHGMAPDTPMNSQPLVSRGPIVVGDHAWLGYGVIVLSGVRIGSGAVIGAGSVVTQDIPEGAIAMGAPARVVKMRADLAAPSFSEGKAVAKT
jgi:acetyltransferase-like isoleucine patch superfamily enzyme